MYYHHTSVSALGLFAVMSASAAAQTSVLTLYIPGADVQPLVASVIGSDATATTYALQCAPGTDSNDCGINGVVTLTEGPKTAAYTFPAEMDESGSVAFTGYMDCSLAGTTSAVCVESYGGDQANFPGITTETYSGTQQPYMPVTITAGAAAAKATTGGGSRGSSSPTTPATPAAATGGVSSATAKNTAAGSSSTSASSGSASQPTSSSGKTSGAGYVSEANIKFALGGAAAVLALI